MLCAIAFLLLCVRTDAEVFTSIAELEDLLEIENRIIDDLEMYILKEEERLLTVKRYLHVLKIEHDKAMEDVPNYIGNPINAFTLVKRLTTDLDYLNNSIKVGEEYINSITMKHADVTYPTVEDLTGAALALSRIQKVYRLDVKELAEGKLNGVADSALMTASDCYELGQKLYKAADYQNALAWMLEAFRQYYEENISYPFTVDNILDHINNTCYKLDDPKTALNWIQKVLDMNLELPRAKEILAFYSTLLITAEEQAKLKEISKTEESKEVNKKKTKAKEKATLIETYEAMCRGEIEVPIQLSSRLTCRYLSENHPFLTIAPFKIEMLYLKPDVVLFHDVVSDGEIETLKLISRPKFIRALVKASNGTSVPSNIRTSKLAWLEDKESGTVARITQRVTHMTGLSTATADKLQVVNYGIGGHYEPHFDFFNKRMDPAEEDIIVGKGNRIATTLFYMSDVTQGGATVFTSLGVGIAPVKGTAILWFNLHASATRDIATKHAACPIVQGSKWVFTKWLYQAGQEFLKPCNLEYQEEDHHLSKIPPPVAKTSNQAVPDTL